MLNFSVDFFKSEYRSNFHVDSMVKRAWASQLEVLSVVDTICKKNNIHYFAFYGTMLGAVRHKGYIPWDDDLDIAMKRSDYNRFLDIIENFLPDKYVFISPYNQTEWSEQFSRITNSHSINFSSEHLRSFHGFPYVTGIDIFPIDTIPGNTELAKAQYKFYTLTLRTRELILNSVTEKVSPEIEEEINSNLFNLEETFNFNFYKDSNLDNQLLCLADQIAASYGNDTDKKSTIFADKLKRLNEDNEDFLFETDWFNSFIDTPFENITIPIPAEYDLCLKSCYGNDYMTPKTGFKSHDYPFYKKQEEILISLGRYDEVMEAVQSYIERNEKGTP